MFLKKHQRKYVGEYKIIEKIGEGRYGVCYLARKNDGKGVVIKQFKRPNNKKLKHHHSFEAVILSQIEHDAIPQLLGVIRTNDFYGFVLEQKSGLTLEHMLFKQQYHFSNTEIFQIGYQLIQILKYLHGNDIVHRDIRIPNVLIDKGRVFLIDFGLARWVNNHEYRFDQDFSYLADLLLYLHYSSFKKEDKKQKAWYEELRLTKEQIFFYKRMLRLETPYTRISEVERDFIAAFS